MLVSALYTVSVCTTHCQCLHYTFTRFLCYRQLRGYIIDWFSIPAALLNAWQPGGARPRSAASFPATEQVFINTVRVADKC